MLNATFTPISDPFAAEQNVAPLRSLRDRYPDNLFVHETYQDTVHRHGIEGHLQELEDYYAGLELKHPGDAMYHYLRLRAIVGRTTPAAIQGMNEMLGQAPDFAPAYRVLAEIHGGPSRYHNAAEERVERAKYLALCPGETLVQRPAPPPDRSSLLDEAEKLFESNGDPDRVLAMTEQAKREEEWRNQRIRAFDWYTVNHKSEIQQQVRCEYWQAWSIEVRCHRKAGHPEKAAELLALMEQRAEALRNRLAPEYRNAMDILSRLYAEGRQAKRAVDIR